MSRSFAAADRERHEELLAALEELVQAVSTLHGQVTLDGTDLTDLAVGNLAALLDDARTAGGQSQARPSLDPAVAVRAAAEHRRLVHAIRRTTQALQEAAVARIDAQAPAVRSELVDAISNLIKAFRQFGASGADPTLGAEITRLIPAINQSLLGFLRLGYGRTAALSGDPAPTSAAAAGTVGSGPATGVDAGTGRKAVSPGEDAGAQPHAGSPTPADSSPRRRPPEVPETEPSIDLYRVVHRSALHLCLRFKAKEAWALWTVAAGVRRWAAAQAGALRTLAVAHATDGDTYRDRGLYRQAERHYEASLNLLIPLEGGSTVEQVRERLAEVERHTAGAAGASTQPGSVPPGARRMSAAENTAGVDPGEAPATQERPS